MVNHATRRKIITWLMIFGNAGIVTVIITSTSSLVNSKGVNLLINFLVLILGLYLIYKFATKRKIIDGWKRFVEKKLIKSAAFEEDPVEDLLHLIEGYGLVKLIITAESSILGKSIAENELADKAVLVLGIERDTKWIPIPPPGEVIMADDRIVLYGSLKELRGNFQEKV